MMILQAELLLEKGTLVELTFTNDFWGDQKYTVRSIKGLREKLQELGSIHLKDVKGLPK